MVPHPRIAILGAGPIGLEAALAAADADLPFTVFETERRVGGAVHQWDHVRLFTPWDMNVSPRVRSRLRTAGVEPPEGDACPTGSELRRHVLEPLARLQEVAPNLRLGHRVVRVGREGLLKQEAIGDERRARQPFRLLVEDEEGTEEIETAEVVLDCTGSWTHPNPAGDAGIPAPGERAAADRIVRRIPPILDEPERWAGRRVLVLGHGHSAQTAVRDLDRLAERHPGTFVTWAIRSPEPDWGDPDQDPLRERARLTRSASSLAAGKSSRIRPVTGVVMERIDPSGEAMIVHLRHRDGRRDEVEADTVLALTGSVGDHLLYRELQVHECYATSGPMKLSAALLGSGSSDCLEQSGHGAEALVNPEPGFFILGAKSYGRNNTFLLRVGWDQVDDVFGLLKREPGVVSA